MGLQDLMAAQADSLFATELFGESVVYTPRNKAPRTITANLFRDESTAVQIHESGEDVPRRARLSCKGSDLVGDDWVGDLFEFDDIQWRLEGAPETSSGRVFVTLNLVSVRRRKVGGTQV